MRPEDQRDRDGCRLAFEEEWPPLARRLHVVLRNRKLSPDRTEDIVQETGLRLFEIWDKVDPEREPWPLALTIALNIVRDQMRNDSRRRQIVSHEELIEKSAERCALARVELLNVGEALEHLTAAQRSALLAEVGLEADPLENSSALKMLRMRARRRLRDLMEGASGVVATVEFGLHKLSRTGFLYAGEQWASSVSLAAGVVCIATLAGAGSPAQALPSTNLPHPRSRIVQAQESAHPAVGRSVARIYESAVDARKHGDRDFFEIEKAVAEHTTGTNERSRTHPSERKRGLTPGPNIGPRATHSEEATVGREGYRAGGRVNTQAAGHSVGAELESSGTRNPPGKGCSDEGSAGARCSTASPADVEARARAELDEKGIELGVGGKRSS